MFYYLNTINLNIYYISFKINRNLLQRKCQALSPLSPNVHLHQSTNHPYVIWFDLQSRTTHKWTHHKLSLSGLTLIFRLLTCSQCVAPGRSPVCAHLCLLRFPCYAPLDLPAGGYLDTYLFHWRLRSPSLLVVTDSLKSAKKLRLFTLMLDFLFDINLPNKLLYLPLFLSLSVTLLSDNIKNWQKNWWCWQRSYWVTTVDWQENKLRQSFKLIFNLIQQPASELLFSF